MLPDSCFSYVRSHYTFLRCGYSHLLRFVTDNGRAAVVHRFRLIQQMHRLDRLGVLGMMFVVIGRLEIVAQGGSHFARSVDLFDPGAAWPARAPPSPLPPSAAPLSISSPLLARLR
jgi:hypothetical protein